MAELTAPSDLERVLRDTHSVAVLGAHDDALRPAFYVPDYLVEQGYRVFPVNPHLRGASLWGHPVRDTLAELEEPIDLVDVFRNSSRLMEHLGDILAMKPLPKVVWLQRGVRSESFTRALVDQGIDVVQDHCILADHRRLGVGRKKSTP